MDIRLPMANERKQENLRGETGGESNMYIDAGNAQEGTV